MRDAWYPAPCCWCLDEGLQEEQTSSHLSGKFHHRLLTASHENQISLTASGAAENRSSSFRGDPTCSRTAVVPAPSPTATSTTRRSCHPFTGSTLLLIHPALMDLGRFCAHRQQSEWPCSTEGHPSAISWSTVGSQAVCSSHRAQ